MADLSADREALLAEVDSKLRPMPEADARDLLRRLGDAIEADKADLLAALTAAYNNYDWKAVGDAIAKHKGAAAQ